MLTYISTLFRECEIYSWNLISNESQDHWNRRVLSAISSYHFILHFIPFVFSEHIFLRVDVHFHTGHTTYFEHHSAPERVTRPWIRLPSVLFRWWTAVLLPYTSAYGINGSSISSCIYCMWHQFDLPHTSRVRFVGYQRVSIF